MLIKIPNSRTCVFACKLRADWEFGHIINNLLVVSQRCAEPVEDAKSLTLIYTDGSLVSNFGFSSYASDPCALERCNKLWSSLGLDWWLWSSSMLLRRCHTIIGASSAKDSVSSFEKTFNLIYWSRLLKWALQKKSDQNVVCVFKTW